MKARDGKSDDLRPAEAISAKVSAAIVADSVRRRRITLTEALKLADEIMRRAEEGRIGAAEDEANRQFGLESFS